MAEFAAKIPHIAAVMSTGLNRKDTCVYIALNHASSHCVHHVLDLACSKFVVSHSRESQTHC
jgi:hypothetical protein